MTDEFVIKLSGKANLPQALEIGHNVHVELEGSIISETKTDNDDGTHTIYYTFRPVSVVTITGKGERIHAKDTRSRSTQMRALIYKRWREANVAQEFDEYYDAEMIRIINSL